MGNRMGRYNGRIDEPLSEEGFRQAENVGILPHVPQVYVSPMLRARQTALVCFPNAKQIVIPDLREMDFGDFEGRTANDMVGDKAYRAWVDGYCEGVCPNGESKAILKERTSTAFSNIVCAARNAGEKNLYIVGHGGTVMSIMSVFVKEPNDYYDWYTKNCWGWQAELDDQAWPQLRLINYRVFERLLYEDDV